MKYGLLLALWWPLLTMASPLWHEDLERALDEARRSGRPVLVDFYAPWCYSCYFMDQQVLETTAFAQRAARLVPVKVDVDTPPGAAIKQRRGVSMLPSYLLLDPAGHELDRLAGEQTPADFFAWLDGRLDGPPPPARPASAADAIATLQADVRRRSFAAGLRWFAALSADLQAAVQQAPSGRAALSRLRLLAALDGGDAAQCQALAPAALESAADCQKAYVVSEARRCLETPAARREWAAAAAPTLLEVVDRRVLVPPGQRCADARSPVQMAVISLRETGQDEAAMQLLDRMIAQLRAELGNDVGGNRNLADNLRLFLDLAGRDEELLALYPQLIRAWPADYVYADRYGRALAARGRLDEAVEQYAAAAELAYGINRLRLAGRHADALLALGRKDAARAVLVTALKRNGKWFAEDAAELRAKLRQL